MTFFGSADSGGNAVRRSYSVLRTPLSLALRPYIINHSLRMTATPSRNNQLWHPTRGISFSPGTASPVPPIQSPRTVIDVPAGANQHHIATQNEAWSVAVIPRETPTQRAQPIPPRLNVQELAEPADLCISVQASADGEVEVTEAERKVTDDPPPPLIEYQMVDDLFYAAKKAPPDSPESFWSYTHYRHTAEDGSSHKVKVHYCTSKHTMERVCKQYFMDEKVLGFDLEWMIDVSRLDGVKKNVSLIQLATPSRIGLFHVALFADSDDMVGPSFRSLMQDPGVVKAGVSIKGDATRLRNFLDIDSRGLMELSHLYKLVTYSRSHQYHNINRRLVPLATQVEEYLHLPLFKGQSVRSSDWSRRLDMDQILYAASDAYAGLQLYLTLEHHRRQLDPCPPSPHHAELNLAIRLADGVVAVRPKISESSVSTKTKTTIVSEKKSASTPKYERPKDSRVEVVEDRVAAYRTCHPQTRASSSQLRAYYLWHCYDLSPVAVAQLLRNPPLKTITVVQYIMSVVQSEKLPVDRDRLREVADFIPKISLWRRWPVVAGMVAKTAS